MIRSNPVREKLARGEVALGTWTKITDPAAVEVLALCGFDFTVIDREHVALDNALVTDLIRAAELSGITPIVRPREARAVDILHALDAGALGVQVPNVNSADEARAVVKASRYHPLGERGFALSHRAGGYGTIPAERYLRLANEEILVICYCETVAACDDLPATLEVEGLDVVFFGPYDLSQSLGVPGRMDDPELMRRLEEGVRATVAAGKVAGIIAADAAEAHFWAQRGCRYITLSADLGLLSRAGREVLNATHGLISEPAGAGDSVRGTGAGQAADSRGTRGR